MTSTLKLMTPEGQLSRAIVARLADLGWTQTELIRRSGVSAFTVRRMMHGEMVEYRLEMKRRIADALGWTPDSVDRILRGDEPLVAGELPAGTAASGVDLSDLTVEDRARVLGYIDALRARRHHN